MNKYNLLWKYEQKSRSRSLEFRHYRQERMEIVEDKDEGGFVFSFPELPGCITCGETVESAVANAFDAKRAWLESAMMVLKSMSRIA